MPTAVLPERLYKLRDLEAAGYSNRVTLQRRISEGRIPAVKVGNRYMIRESDLPFIAQEAGAPRPDVLAAHVDAVIDGVSSLTDEQRERLCAAVAPAP